jgi:hypothetical protein
MSVSKIKTLGEDLYDAINDTFGESILETIGRYFDKFIVVAKDEERSQFLFISSPRFLLVEDFQGRSCLLQFFRVYL